MKNYVKTVLALLAALCALVGSISVILAMNTHVDEMTTGVVQSVNPNMAIVAALLATMAGIVVFARRNHYFTNS